MEYDSTLFVRLLPPAPAAFLAGTLAAFFPTAGVLAILLNYADTREMSLGLHFFFEFFDC